MREPTRKNAILDLLLVYREVLMGEVGTDSYIGYSDYEIVMFKICGERGKDATN